ncbi:helicase ARIP4 [Teleopsis dalmanni]|uniref:helicase ARIP4 n=1 Tax=Teleopsis dalmanni TaxID=139649 RepID=UPI0018CDA025|nr:helicase ARIP4 [Teleopsis dalmanni]
MNIDMNMEPELPAVTHQSEDLTKGERIENLNSKMYSDIKEKLNEEIDISNNAIVVEDDQSLKSTSINTTVESSEIQEESDETILLPELLNKSGHKRKHDADADADVEEVSDSKMPTTGSLDDKKIVYLRKNIRDVMDEKQLDSNTLVAQREESERLARVAEQQKVIREYQRQAAANRLNMRTQNRVLSLLQSGNNSTKAFTKTDRCFNRDITNLRHIACENKLSMKQSALIKKPFNNMYTSIKNEIKPKTFFDSMTKESNNQIKQEVVTIDSSSDEDDCIVLSDDEEIVEDEVEDDPANSGLHVKDTYNMPDEHGRVVVNIGHPEGEEDIFVAPQIAKKIKPHQIGGVRFLFDNIIESTKRFKNSSGFGCILAHSMGLGKTLQVICFCDIFLRHTSSKSVLCVMPINTIQNWLSEFNTWTPKTSDDEDVIRTRRFDVFVLNDSQKTLTARAKVIMKWAEEGGVLLIGYELFRLLALKLLPTRKRRGKNIKAENLRSEANMRLMESVHQALVKPGPDLVICDEGHRIKNSHAGISVALKQIRTRRRIVLTGYPLQNNLLEYWCMVDFVRPNYLGSRTEFCNMFERPIQNGQCIDSTPQDIKLMRYRAHVLHSLLLGFVQRRSHLVLQQTLPQKLEYVILTKMTSFQRELYNTFMNDVVRKKTIPNPLKAFAVCCKIWNHPDVLYNFLKKRETDLDLEIDDAEGISEATPPNPNANKLEATNTPPTNNHDIKDKIVEDTKSQAIEAIETSEQQRNLNERSFNTQNKPIAGNCNETSNENSFNKSFYNMYNNLSYSTNCTDNNYWQDTNVPCFIYQPTPSNVYSSMNQTDSDQRSEFKDTDNITSSSEICDLDTNEIKTMKTNMMKFEHKLKTPVFNPLETQKNEVMETEKITQNKLPKIEDENAQSDLKKIISDVLPEKEMQKVRHEEPIPYEWATELMKKYDPGLIKNSPKMEIVFFILEKSIAVGDRVLLFSQSLLTLNLLESFLCKNLIPGSDTCWSRNTSYFRLDGSTSSQEREKLVNEFNTNLNVKLFLISTKAGSLGINLVGANRVIVFDASWNPCHDTQAVYRIYRYGQQKSCFVYRIVMDKCLEKKIYDRQIKKQGMSDRVVDECNPDAHLSTKDVTNLCYDYEDEDKEKEKTDSITKEEVEPLLDDIMQEVVDNFSHHLSKVPFYHDSLLIDRKEKKLSNAEKRQAHRGYEMEKKASTKQNINFGSNIKYHIGTHNGAIISRPVASIRPMQAAKSTPVRKAPGIRTTRWIPAEVWQRQGMTAQEMTLPLDVVIPTNSSDKANIILKAGQRVMVLKSVKGIYMQLESGKIIAIRTSNKANEVKKLDKDEVIDITSEGDVAETTSSSNNLKSEKSHTASLLSNKIEPKSNGENFESGKKLHDIKKDKEPQNKNIGSGGNISNKISSIKSNPKDNSETSSNLTKYPSLNNGIRDNSVPSNSNTYTRNSIFHNERTNETETCYNNYINETKDLYEKPSISSVRNSLKVVEKPTKTITDEDENSSDFAHGNRETFIQSKSSMSNAPIKANNSYDNISDHNNGLDSLLKANQTNSTNITQNSMGANANANLGKTVEESQNYSTEYTGKKSTIQQQSTTENMNMNQIAQYPMNQEESHQNQKLETYVPPYNQYNNSTVPQPIASQPYNMESHTTNNMYHANQNINYHQYYENMYENNNAQAPCDYSTQFVDNSYNPYNNAQYQPNFHTNTYGSNTANPYHPHHWPSLVPSAPTNIQRSAMYPSTYSQFGSPDQWHH